MLHVWDQDGFGYFCKRCATRSRLGPGGAVAEELCPTAVAERPYIPPVAALNEADRLSHLRAMGGPTAAWLDLFYMLLAGESDLDRQSRAAVATVAAQTAGSHYMAEAMRSLLAPELAVALSRGIQAGPLDPALAALLAFAAKLTRKPTASARADIDLLRSHGYTDEAILTAIHLVGFVCHGVRLAEGLGAPLEPYMATPRPE